MPKQLINLLGIVVCVGILALAVAVVAMPIYFQSVSTNGQTAEVQQTNDIYQAQVDALRVEEERMPEIEESVASLRTEVPAVNEFDEVFELVAQAASAADVQVQTVTAGENVSFVVRTSPLAAGEIPEAAAEAPAEDAAADDAAAAEGEPDASADGAEQPAQPTDALDARQQVDFTITVTADQLSDAVAFLDELRRGPRLLSSIQSTVIPTGTGYDVSVSALTFVRTES